MPSDALPGAGPPLGPPHSGRSADTPDARAQVGVIAVETAGVVHRSDAVAIEEPLEIRVAHAGRQHPIAVTMRTPGHDRELAAGFLLSEAVVRAAKDLETIREVPAGDDGRPSNAVTAFLADGVAFDAEALRRNVYTASSCGICGRATLDRVATVASGPPVGDAVFDRAHLVGFPELLRDHQDGFTHTGGVHAAGLFAADGRMSLIREDVGRHNAVDKVVGARLLSATLPASHDLLMVSGRASYELVQKALMAGIPILAAVGAPSSLAVSLARAFGMTLIGFLRDGRFNVYSGAERVAIDR